MSLEVERDLNRSAEIAASDSSMGANVAINLEAPAEETADMTSFETERFSKFETFSVARPNSSFFDWYRWSPSYLSEMYWDRVAAISDSDAQ
jgi:hypothetical protein